MYRANLRPLSEAANHLGVSEALIQKFIKKGLIVPIQENQAPKLTDYSIRRLRQIMDLYEKSYDLEKIAHLLDS